MTITHFVFDFCRENIKRFCIERRSCGLFKQNRNKLNLSDNADPVYQDLDDPVHHPTPEYDQSYSEMNWEQVENVQVDLEIHDYQNNRAGFTENDGMRADNEVYYSTPATKTDESYQNVGILENEDSDASTEFEEYSDVYYPTPTKNTNNFSRNVEYMENLESDGSACVELGTVPFKIYSDCSLVDGAYNNPGFDLEKNYDAKNAADAKENIELENMGPDQYSDIKEIGTVAIKLYNENVEKSTTENMGSNQDTDIMEKGTELINLYNGNVPQSDTTENMGPDSEYDIMEMGTVPIKHYSNNVRESTTENIMGSDSDSDIKEIGTVPITIYNDNVSYSATKSLNLEIEELQMNHFK